MKLLIDVDNTVLNYDKPFIEWMKVQHNVVPLKPVSETRCFQKSYQWNDDDYVRFIEDFSHSEHFSRLPALDEAAHSLSRFHKSGFEIVAITACVDTAECRKLRERNLMAQFGDIIDDIIIVGLGNNKNSALKAFSRSIWVDDMAHHASAGVEAGHISYWYGGVGNAPHGVTPVWSWSEIVSRHLP